MSLAELTGIRATAPERVEQGWSARRRRPLLPPDGRLLLVAADHPARAALGVRDRPDAMADRSDLLQRLLIALANPAVDGVLGTADILDDLLLLGALDGKVVVGSMNRGGLQDTSFELDDRFTGYTAPVLAARGLDGGKMLTRIDPDDPATVRTLEHSARAIDQLAAQRLMAMVEPFWCERSGGRVRNLLTPPAIIRSIAVASGLGSNSAHTWLKLPAVDGIEQIMAATTLPTLLLGGDPTGHPDDTYAAWEAALTLPGVRGLIVGRALLYPQDDDVAAAVATAAALVHGGTRRTGTRHDHRPGATGAQA